MVFRNPIRAVRNCFIYRIQESVLATISRFSVDKRKIPTLQTDYRFLVSVTCVVVPKGRIEVSHLKQKAVTFVGNKPTTKSC